MLIIFIYSKTNKSISNFVRQRMIEIQRYNTNFVTLSSMSNHRNTTDSVFPTSSLIITHSHHESNVKKWRNMVGTWTISSFVQRGLGLSFFKRHQNISVSPQLSNSASLYSASLCCCSDLASRHATCHALFCTSPSPLLSSSPVVGHEIQNEDKI